MRRRDFLLALPGLAFLPQAIAEPRLASLIAGYRRWGNGQFRKFGFLIYEATLWATGQDPTQPPLALELTYKRNLSGRRIAEASVSEIRNLKLADESALREWGEHMAQIFPDVQAEDRIVGVHLPDGAEFFHNERPIGRVADPAFAEAFFGIWLHVRTSAPELRQALLKPPLPSPLAGEGPGERGRHSTDRCAPSPRPSPAGGEGAKPCGAPTTLASGFSHASPS
jgi:hypothetical protein